MERDEIRDSILATWRNHEILLYLLAHVPPAGMKARPAGSKGRDVTAQFAHLALVRRGWVDYFTTGRYPKVPRYDKATPPSKAALRQTLAASACPRRSRLKVSGANGSTASSREPSKGWG